MSGILRIMPGKLVYVARPSGMRADLPRTSVLLQQILQQIREPASSLAGNMRRACLEALLFPGKGRLCSFMIDIHVYVGSDNFVGNLFNSLVVFCNFHLVIAALHARICQDTSDQVWRRKMLRPDSIRDFLTSA